MNRQLYALHRWVSLAVLLQLGAWTTSGLFFAVMPVASVKGTPVEHAHETALHGDRELFPIAGVLEALGRRGEVTRLTLAQTPSGVFYTGKVGGKSFRLDARTGDERHVDEHEAREIAQRDQPGRPPVLACTFLEGAADLEYRTKPLPAWRVVLADDQGTVVYVDAITGDVSARRNDVWRIYDFLWALHIMDYRERETFRHPLLVGAASIGLLTVISGSVLWMIKARRWWRARTQKRRQAREASSSS